MFTYCAAGKFESQGEEKVGELSVELEALRSQLKASEDQAVALNNSLQQAREEVRKSCGRHTLGFKIQAQRKLCGRHTLYFKIQTHQRFKRTLIYYDTELNLGGVIPFVKLQNDT